MFSLSRLARFALLAVTLDPCAAVFGDGAEGISHMVSPNISNAEKLSKQLKVANGAADGIVGTAKASSVDLNAMNRLTNNIGTTVSRAITSGTTGAAKDTQDGTSGNAGTGNRASTQLAQNGRNHLSNISKAIQEASQLMESLQPAVARYEQAGYTDTANQLREDIKTIGKIRESLEAEAAATQTEIIQADDAAKKFADLEKNAGTRSEDMSSLAQKAMEAAKQADGGGGGSGSSGISSASPNLPGHSVNAGSNSISPFGRGSGPQGPVASGKPFGIGEMSNSKSFDPSPGIAAKFSGNTPDSSAVGSLKDKLRDELAGRKATPSDPALAKAIEQAQKEAEASKKNLLNPDAASTSQQSYGDLGLAVGLGGSGDFGDMLKGVLGINSSEQNLSEEEKALLESRRLASLSSQFAPLPPEVLGADTQNLFKRTRERIEASLKRGKVMNGLNSKL